MAEALIDTPDDDRELPALVPARMVNEVLYCERLFYLEWVQREFEDNHFTVEGRAKHARTDQGGGALPPPPLAVEEDAEPGDEARLEFTSFVARSVWLSSTALGLTAKIDLVEGEDGSVTPVEYKRGRAPDLPEGAYLPERAQVCVQVLLLREHGYRCEGAEIYFAAERRRVRIEISEELVSTTMEALRRARELAASRSIPPPLVDSPKCFGCSLAGICLPDETHLLRELAGVSVVETSPGTELCETDEDSPEPTAAARRLYAARDDRLPVYVQEHGTRLRLKGDLLTVETSDGKVEARLPNTSQVALFGNVQVTTQAMKALLERDIPLGIFTFGGWFLGRTWGLGSKNVELRVAQHRLAADRGFSLRVAQRVTASKILNCRTMVRRNHPAPSEEELKELRLLANKALRAESLASLLGIEGTAARRYFRMFAEMLRPGSAWPEARFEDRNRRPPRDPINALLSFTYALLVKDLVLAVHAVGLEPLLGFYHQPRYGRPALALDLMEEFRPIIADSVVLSAVNNGVFDEGDFVLNVAGCTIKPAARKKLIAAYERRMDHLVTHPLFDYRLSYRRVLELQARLLSRLILGEIPEYPMFRTR